MLGNYPIVTINRVKWTRAIKHGDPRVMYPERTLTYPFTLPELGVTSANQRTKETRSTRSAHLMTIVWSNFPLGLDLPVTPRTVTVPSR